MIGFILRRLAGAVPLLLFISVVTYAMMALAPGGPAAVLGPRGAASPAVMERLTALYGLDKPWFVQYFYWLKQLLLHGSLGTSYVDARPVVTKVFERLPVTLEMVGLALLLTLLIAIPIGIYAGAHRGSFFERAGVWAGDCRAGQRGRRGLHRHQLPRVRRADARPRRRHRVTLIIAIDGPAAAGKGTLARRLAAELGLAYLDTGLLYRAVGRRMLDLGLAPSDPVAAGETAAALTAADLLRTDLRGPKADQASSLVAKVPGVRAALLAFQRDFASQGAVLDGRDIGTVVVPGAQVKLFVTADPATRASRRWLELQVRGVTTPLAQIEAELRARDAQDTAREAAPLTAASDAFVLDTTLLDADAAFAAALEIVRSRAGFA